jgi:hypothetical protein
MGDRKLDAGDPEHPLALREPTIRPRRDILEESPGHRHGT